MLNNLVRAHLLVNAERSDRGMSHSLSSCPNDIANDLFLGGNCRPFSNVCLQINFEEHSNRPGH
jgi:hypothetical protein